jgi:hypothetical protein
MSEKQEQIALFQRAELHPICRDYMWHTPNGGYRNMLEAVSLKRQGVKPGVPDITLAYPTENYPGLYIELKNRKKGKPTTEQQQMIDRLRSVGYRAEICHGWEAAWDVIEEYLR